MDDAPDRLLLWLNLQMPYERTGIGIESMDLMFDVVAEPDLAARVRAEADAVIDRLDQRAAPFDEPWPDWRPDPPGPSRDSPISRSRGRVRGLGGVRLVVGSRR